MGRGWRSWAEGGGVQDVPRGALHEYIGACAAAETWKSGRYKGGRDEMMVSGGASTRYLGTPMVFVRCVWESVVTGSHHHLPGVGECHLQVRQTAVRNGGRRSWRGRIGGASRLLRIDWCGVGVGSDDAIGPAAPIGRERAPHAPAGIGWLQNTDGPARKLAVDH
jgi:hypothetical protein